MPILHRPYILPVLRIRSWISCFLILRKQKIFMAFSYLIETSSDTQNSSLKNNFAETVFHTIVYNKKKRAACGSWYGILPDPYPGDPKRPDSDPHHFTLQSTLQSTDIEQNRYITKAHLLKKIRFPQSKSIQSSDDLEVARKLPVQIICTSGGILSVVELGPFFPDLVLKNRIQVRILLRHV